MITVVVTACDGNVDGGLWKGLLLGTGWNRRTGSFPWVGEAWWTGSWEQELGGHSSARTGSCVHGQPCRGDAPWWKEPDWRVHMQTPWCSNPLRLTFCL